MPTIWFWLAYVSLDSGVVTSASVKEVEIESIRKKLARAADTGYSMWHNA